MNKIHYKKIEKKIKDFEVVKSNKTNGNNSDVYTDGDLYYKIWPSNWNKSSVVNHAVKSNFYDSYSIPILTKLIYDGEGHRGYITKKGKHLYDKSINKGYKYWDYMVENTTNVQRKDFILSLLNRSLQCQLLFTDLCPTNLLLYNDDISLIDLDSCHSFSYIFYGKPMNFEKLTAHHSDHLERSRYSCNLLYRDYLRECLGIDYDKTINSENKLKEIIKLIEKIGK